MKDMFKKTTNSIICSSIIAFIIGLIMVISPDMTIKTLGIIMSIYFILHGLVLIILDITSDEYYVPYDSLLSGILSVIVGIVLIGKPDVLATIYTIAIGVWIALSSINSLKMAMALRKEDSPWVLLLLLGIIDLIVGLVVVFNPFGASLSITVFAGIMIIIHSIINIVDMIIIKKNVKAFSKAIEKKIKDIK